MSENAKIERPKRVTVKSLRVQLERAHADRAAAEVLLKRAEKQRDELDRQVREAKKMATAFRGLQLDWHASMNEGREKYLDGELGRTREKLAEADQRLVLAAQEQDRLRAELEQSPERQAITLYMLKNNELTRERDRLAAELAAVTDRAADAILERDNLRRAASQPLTYQAEPDCACNRCELIRARATLDSLRAAPAAWAADRNRVLAERDRAVTEAKDASRCLHCERGQKEELLETNSQLEAERDRMKNEAAIVQARAEKFRSDYTEIHKQLYQAAAERDRLLQQNDRLRAELDAAVEHFKRTSDERYRLKQQNDRQAETIEGLFGRIDQAHKLATEGRAWLRYGFTPYATAKVESLLEQIRGLMSVCQPIPDGKPAEPESEPLILVWRVNTR